MSNKHQPINIVEWLDLKNKVAQLMYDDGISEKHRFLLLSKLDYFDSIMLNLNPEEFKIYNRRDHRDATHYSNSLFNPAFYMCLGGRDFYYCVQTNYWLACEWEGSQLDDEEMFLSIKVSK